MVKEMKDKNNLELTIVKTVPSRKGSYPLKNA